MSQKTGLEMGEIGEKWIPYYSGESLHVMEGGKCKRQDFYWSTVKNQAAFQPRSYLTVSQWKHPGENDLKL